ncbi:MAG: FAD:protein FMN transferase [Pirellula sp.]|jgi:thiamine biosynthesis lipoprotein
MNRRDPIWLEFTRMAMACQFDVLLHPERPEHGPEVAVEALELIEWLEQILSVYIPTSDLSRLNKRGQETWVDVSMSAFEMLKLGCDINQQTQGCFDMTAAKLSEAWGFSSRQGRMPSELQIAESLAQVGSQNIEFDDAHRKVRFVGPIAVNPGGIGKGYAIDQAVAMLRDRGIEDFAIHGGKSSVSAYGKQLLEQIEPGWKIAVRHPEQSERILGTLFLRNRSLGTSGPANQFFYFKGERYGHIIDPRTGWPARGALSVTILHPSAAWADALATGMYVMGVEKSLEFCSTRPEVGYLAILPGKRDGEAQIITCNIDQSTWVASRD